MGQHVDVYNTVETGSSKDPDYLISMVPDAFSMPEQLTPMILLDRKKDASLQTQLALSLKNLVQSGVLRPGQAVPSSRELARELQISRNTVIQAYDRLVGEGYLAPSPRRGLFVSEFLVDRSLRSSGRAAAPSTLSGSVFQRRSEQVGPPVPFRPCQPDVRLFPLQVWNRLRARVLRRHDISLLHYQSQLTLGLPALRRSLATYLRESRGVQCDWRQVAVTTGSQQALYLLAHMLLQPGSRVAMEDPGYLGARLAWKDARAVIDPVPVDSEGMRVSQDELSCVELLYTTPSRQFPTGACLSLPRRLSLVKFAARTKAWIVEDDYDSEFRYSRPPLPSLQSLDPSGRVIYVGSMSKVLFPSLRIGYVVLPAVLVDTFAALRAVMDDHGPLIDQAVLAEFIEAGAFYTHIRRCRAEYRLRLDTFIASVSNLGLPLFFPHIDGGMNMAGFLEYNADDRECSRRLQGYGLDVPSLSHYALRPTRPGLVFGFTAFEPQTIRQSIKCLSGVLS
jgi:GntR family transcriptional regulator/MocR family aminotransferase